jgi:methyltransferase (TIGR00027 family)
MVFLKFAICDMLGFIGGSFRLVIDNGQPSPTALTAAAARAAHLIVDRDPRIFSDPLAGTLLGDRAGEFISFHRAHGGHVVLRGARAAVTTRSRYTEDRLAESVGRGTGQYVVLGAGLDSFAFRSPWGEQVRVFEVDHAATQEWKRERLAAAGLRGPGHLTFVAVDFEHHSLAGPLIEAGFDPCQPAFFSWLGVTMYLTLEAIGQTLAVIGDFAAGTEIIMEYMVPENLRDGAGQEYVELVSPAAAQHGEPWLTFLSPQQVSGLLHEHGFDVIEHARQRDTIDPALWQRDDALHPFELSMLTHAKARGTP